MANKQTNKKQVPKEVQSVVEDQITDSVTVKRIFYSKTIWVNVLAFLAFWVQKEYGFVINEDLQMQALTLINIILRFVTKEPIAWGGENGNSKENS